MTRRQVVAISLLSFVVLTLTTVLIGKDQAGSGKDDGDNKLKAAMTERVQVAKRCLNATEQAYQAQTTTLDQLLDAQRGLKDARLDVATSQADRIKALEQWVKSAQEREQVIKLLNERGMKGGEAMHHAQALRAKLDAEIELYREQAKAE